MSCLVKFYRGEETDSEGRSLQEIWTWPDEELEDVHNFIQWLFPLPDASQYNPNAPLLRAEDIAAFKSDPIIRANLKKSFERILAFLGFILTEDGKVREGKHFSERIPDVWAAMNHNWLRITRILRSLSLLSMPTQAQALYDQLAAFYTSKRFPIPARTFQFWTEALQTDP